MTSAANGLKRMGHIIRYGHLSKQLLLMAMLCRRCMIGANTLPGKYTYFGDVDPV